MLLGKLKQGDIPAPVRDACIRTMVDNYFPKNTVMITGYGFDMLYAGPREAVLHATFRQNMGADYLIVGRDHAGVGDCYGRFDSQNIFKDSVPEGEPKSQFFVADNTAYSTTLDCEEHGIEACREGVCQKSETSVRPVTKIQK